jgi:hypothetical protein
MNFQWWTLDSNRKGRDNSIAGKIIMMKTPIKYSAIIFVMLFGSSALLHSERADDIINYDSYKNKIREMILSHGEMVFLPEIRARLLEDLSRPFAIGGKMNLLHQSQSEMQLGWELIIDGDEYIATSEFTIGNIENGTGHQVTVTVYAHSLNRLVSKFVLVVEPVGPPTNLDEITKIQLTKAQLQALGICKGTIAEGSAAPEREAGPRLKKP